MTDKKLKIVFIYSLSLLICLFIFLLSISLGSSQLSVLSLLKQMFSNLIYSHTLPGSDQSFMEDLIFMHVRLPRVLIAALCGGALAAAGVVSQGLFRNILACPSILGTTAGGGLAAALMFYLGAAYFHWLTLPLAAFGGALLATSLILYIATVKKYWSLENLLIAGFALNAFLGAATSLIVSLMLEDYLKSSAILRWLFGGFSGRGWEHLAIGIGPILVGYFLAFILSQKLNILSLGEEVATSLSINVYQLRRLSILCISLLVGTAVGIAGAIPFVGLIIPQITRFFCGPEHKKLLFLSIINGMSLMMLADLLARTVRSPAELEVGVLTSLLGAPFFLWLLLGKRR